jgi:hypothetical protein
MIVSNLVSVPCSWLAIHIMSYKIEPPNRPVNCEIELAVRLVANRCDHITYRLKRKECIGVFLGIEAEQKNGELNHPN